MASKSKSLAQRIGGKGPWWLKTVRWLLVLGVVGFIGGALLLWILYRTVEIPDANAEFLTETTTVYYSDGAHVLGKLSTQDRESIELNEVSEPMQAAVIAAEDRTFWKNRGLDFKGILRALRDNTSSGEITSGGSTITQQYVKLLYLTQERTLSRKAKEAALALKVHNKLTKEEILEGYLNTVYYGNGAYGVEVASRTYFDKKAKDLTVAESAVLATIINIPSYYDPYVEGGRERLVPRYNYVLDGMLEAGDITSAEHAEFRDKLPKFNERKVSQRYAGPEGFLLKMVEQEMNDLQFSDDRIFGAGYQIVSTFDYKKEKAAKANAWAQGPDPRPKDLHRTIVSIEPGRGAVRALYGGPDYLKDQRNWATFGTQPGSTFKVFTLAAALDSGYSLKTRLNGNSPIYIGGKPVENQGDSGGRPYGIINLTKATQSSVNTAYIDMQQQLGNGSFERGAEEVLEMAGKLGLPESTIKAQPRVAVTTLGVEKVAPIDMANAYATLVAGGERADWYVVEKVKKDGAEIYKHEVKTERVIPERVAGDALVAMKAVVQGGTGSKAATFCPTVGKTGTATAGFGQSQWVSSSWFVGSTPKLTTAVMQNRGKGNGDLEAILGGAFIGGGYPAQTFRAYMNQALEGTDCGKFPDPGNIRGDKGKTLAPPTSTVKCPPNYELKGDKCHPKTVKCPTGEILDPGTNTCVKLSCPDGWVLSEDGKDCEREAPPTTEPTTPPPVDYSQYKSEAACENAGGVWTPSPPLGGSCGPP